MQVDRDGMDEGEQAEQRQTDVHLQTCEGREDEMVRGEFIDEDGDDRKRKGQGTVGGIYSINYMYSHKKGLHPELLLPGRSRGTAAQKTVQTEP